MRTLNRRWLLKALSAGVLVPACTGTSGSRDELDTAGSDTGIGGGHGTDTGWIDTDTETILADVGPALSRDMPGSLTSASDQELDLTLSVLSGALPTDMLGHSFFVYPIPWRDGSPVFIGDGMVARLDYTETSVKLTTRIARTPCYLADQASVGTEHAFENSGMARMSMTFGARNLANTAFLPMGDRLLLTFDAGRPHELNPATVEIATPVGWMSEWRWALPDWISWFVNWPFPPLMSTAHPAYDPESGHVFSVDYGLSLMGESTFTRLVRWNGEGALEGWELVDSQNNAVQITQSVHQIACTRNYVILADTAFLVEMDLLYEVPAEAQSPDTVFWIVRRSDLVSGQSTVLAKSIVVPREAVHFLADFDDTGDRITLHVSHNCAADPSEFIEPDDVRVDTGAAVRTDLWGLPAAPTDLGAMARYVIDGRNASLLDAEVLLDENVGWGGPALCTWNGQHVRERHGSIWWVSVGFSEEIQLERVESLYADYPYRTVPLDELPTDGRPATLFRLDTETMTVVDRYALPDGRIALSPQHVPRAGATDETEGYIVCVVISDDWETKGSSGDELWIFDAANLAQGPLARLGHRSLNLPFTLHTAWMAAAPERTAIYRVDVPTDLAPEVEKLDASAQEIFTQSVYPYV